ncbi:OLC1v1038966C1 [Oldenlandia corymbosa var. corymbosa]|uniref:OLC1v1038966C1 n=1 Tax=Oldenlandia corymbosa var. corymbosa TaxID=529605 RepID=A0AAV1D2K8_OLDCO|nr:OLC1v1038966C1 [Oldenlandia corymbosa var. corymbosa]
MEAGRIGLMLMAAAGYDPHHAPKFYEKYDNAHGDNFLKATHPSGEKRAKALRKDKVMNKAKDLYDQARARRELESFNEESSDFTFGNSLFEDDDKGFDFIS